MSSSTPLPVIDDDWVLARRGPKHRVESGRAYGAGVEPERQRDGTVDDVLTVLTTNRECPLRCLMCDLWKNTLDGPSPSGSVADQIDDALAAHDAVRRLKIYNAGSFFDRGSIPPADVERIIDATRQMSTIVIESHPRVIEAGALAVASRFEGRLEVALGLETTHPDVLPRLNKRMTLDDFERATARLVNVGCAVRAFILVRPPFMTEEEGFEWAVRSVEWAWQAGVECCVLIPVRGGNGAMEELAREGHFQPPRLATLERVFDTCLHDARGRVFVDLWDAAQFAGGDPLGDARITRMQAMNLAQTVSPPVPGDVG